MEGSKAKKKKRSKEVIDVAEEQPETIPKQRRKSRRLSGETVEDSTAIAVGKCSRLRGDSLEGSVVLQSPRKDAFDLEREASRLDDLAEFVKEYGSSQADIKRFGNSAVRMLCEVFKVSNLKGVEIRLERPNITGIATIKKTIEGLIEELEQVKNEIRGRKKAHPKTLGGAPRKKNRKEAIEEVVIHEPGKRPKEEQI